MVMQTVINSTTKQVQRHGYCDFSTDGSFDSGTEEIIEKDFVFEPPVDGATPNWWWNHATESFQQEAP